MALIEIFTVENTWNKQKTLTITFGANQKEKKCLYVKLLNLGHQKVCSLRYCSERRRAVSPSESQMVLCPL